MTTRVYYNGVEITAEAFEVSIRRGRSRELDEFEAASGHIKLRNHNRNFDPPFFTTASDLLMETGDFLLLENGDHILLEQGSFAAGTYGVIQIGAPLEVIDEGPGGIGAAVVFTGHVEDVNYTWSVNGETEATIVVGDGLSTLARTSLQTDWETTRNELPGHRIESMLDRADVLFPEGGASRSLTAGHSRLIGDTVPAGTNALQYAQLVARTDYGKLFVDRLGRLVYKGRYSWPGASGGLFGVSSADFKDDGTGFAFSNVEVTYGSELLIFQASVSRAVVVPEPPDFGVIAPTGPEVPDDLPTADSAGTPRTAVSSSTPPAALGARSLSISGLLLRNDAECEARAQYLVDRFSQPEGVVSALTVLLETLQNFEVLNRSVLNTLDIHDVVTMTWTPTGDGAVVTQTLAIEGVTYDKTYDGATAITLQLSAMPDTNFLTLDTDSYDSGVPWGF